MPVETLPTPVSRPASPGAPAHLAFLDGLRALAALYVICFHALLEADSTGRQLHGAAKLAASLLTFGHQAVDVFIVLSGFCLMMPVTRGDGSLRGGAWSFFAKRARRILPPYYGALLLSIPLFQFLPHRHTGTYWDTMFPLSWSGILAHVFLLQDLSFRAMNQISLPFWSISVEWRIYFALPLLAWCWRRYGPLAASAAACAVSIILCVVLPRTPIDADPYAVAGAMPQYLGLFALGCFGAGCAFSPDTTLCALRARVPWSRGAALFALVSLLLIKGKFHHHGLPVPVSDYICGLAAMCLLTAAALEPHRAVSRVLSFRPLAFVGTFAYSIYLMHAPLLHLFWLGASHALHLSAGAMLVAERVVGMPLVVTACYGFYWVCERPFVSRDARMMGRRISFKPSPTL